MTKLGTLKIRRFKQVQDITVLLGDVTLWCRPATARARGFAAASRQVNRAFKLIPSYSAAGQH